MGLEKAYQRHLNREHIEEDSIHPDGCFFCGAYHPSDTCPSEDRTRMEKEMQPELCSRCGEGYYQFNDYCGAHVCSNCGDHKGLCRCYCGWAASGGNGRAELIEMGETIEPEDY